MELPGDSIGISDILTYRECERRLSWDLRRHTGAGVQSDESRPELQVAGAIWARGYGSAIHEAIAALEDGFDEDTAIQKAWKLWGRYLEPSDLDLLRKDLETYRTRDFPNVKTVVSEEDSKIPLFDWNGRTIYFRFKLDRLYERLDHAGTFVHVDYKSSKWIKSRVEVHNDLQLWAYNFGIHELFPECDRLVQIYDQLRAGQVPTRKSPEQREQMREWLVKNITTILEDDRVQDDGLLPFSYNDWCAWCPILESCKVVNHLTEYAATRIAALAPVEQEGRRKVMRLEESRIEEYVAEYDKARKAIGVLERFRDGVGDMLKKAPDERRAELGFELRGRGSTVFEQDAIERLHEELGPRFFEVVKITKTALEENLREEPELLEFCLGLGTKVEGGGVLQRVG